MESTNDKAIRSHNRAVWMVIGVVISLLIIFVIGPVIGRVFETSQSDLQGYADDGDYESLLEFIRDNYADRERARILVPLAISHVGRRQMVNGLAELENTYYTTNDNGLKSMILSNLISTEAKFPSFERLWNEYQGRVQKGDASDMVFKMLSLWPFEKSLQCFFNAVDSSLKKSDLETANTFLRDCIEVLSKENAPPVSNLRGSMMQISKIVDERNTQEKYVRESTNLLTQFEFSGASIRNFTIKRRFDDQGGRGVYEVFSINNYERAALIADPNQIPPGMMDRLNVQVVVISQGEKAFPLEDPYGNYLRTEYVMVYETIPRFKDIPDIKRNLPRMKRLLEAGRPRFEKDAGIMLASIRTEVQTAVSQ